MYGSAALALRGVEVVPGDIDVNVSDAYRAGELFDDLMVTPVEELDGSVASRVGRAFCGAIIEWLSEPDAEIDDPGETHVSKARTSRICSRPWSGVATASRCPRYRRSSPAASAAALPIASS